jgi:hypothetical protein
MISLPQFILNTQKFACLMALLKTHAKCYLNVWHYKFMICRKWNGYQGMYIYILNLKLPIISLGYMNEGR